MLNNCNDTVRCFVMSMVKNDWSSSKILSFMETNSVSKIVFANLASSLFLKKGK